jgi:phenylalanyl-tRNA synthetase beta chain
MLNVFLGRKPFPNYRLVQPASGQLEKIIVKEDASELSQFYKDLWANFGIHGRQPK